MRKSTRYSLLIALVLIAALAFAILLLKAAPPGAARLLPEADAIVYINFKPLRLATHLDRTRIERSPDYQHFVDATGIVPERDLDVAAFALHHMDDPTGPNGPVGYSEVFEGRFDAARLTDYLATIATSQEIYEGHKIFTIPVGEPDPKTHAVREFRVAQLDRDSIAASNMPTTEQIHSILDRHRMASPFSGSSLLSARYRNVPLLASAWAIGHIGLPFSDHGHISILGMQLPLPEDTTFVASLRYAGALHFRLEQISPTEADAARSAETLTNLLGLYRSLQQGQTASPSDAAFRSLIESLRIDRHKDRTILIGTIPLDLLKQLTAPPADAQP
jgi:hypothetical protein